jgi:hypothetical protein
MPNRKYVFLCPSQEDSSMWLRALNRWQRLQRQEISAGHYRHSSSIDDNIISALQLQTDEQELSAEKSKSELVPEALNPIEEQKEFESALTDEKGKELVQYLIKDLDQIKLYLEDKDAQTGQMVFKEIQNAINASIGKYAPQSSFNKSGDVSASWNINQTKDPKTSVYSFLPNEKHREFLEVRLNYLFRISLNSI